MRQRGSEILEAIASHELRTSITSILGVTELLDAEYIEQNKQEILIRKEYVDILIRNAKRLERLAEEILDVTKIERGRFAIKMEENRISQVISNLLSNALKFTKDNGIIAVNAKREGNCVIVIVKDSGEGIDNKIFPRLFSKFATNSYQGIGLGLFISKKIIEAHGGKIWAENNPDGRGGATFAFILPTINK